MDSDTRMLFFPLPGTYAVVEIDVGSTLQSLNDPLANAAGAQIKTTKCIVYLDMILQLPFPDDVTFKYMAYLIGPGLRPEHPQLCITPDMCIPIYPNTQHPAGDREALRSDPPFPFNNCYHWFGPDMWLDLRIVNDGRNYRLGARTELPPDQHVKMVGIQGRDIWRSICAQKERDGTPATATSSVPLAAEAAQEDVSDPQPLPQPSTSPAPSAPLENDPASPVELRCDDEYERQQCDRCGTYGECYCVYGSEYGGTDSPRSSLYQFSEGSTRGSTESLAKIDVFGLDGDEQDDLLPIVKISLDIGAEFAHSEDVPNPMEFMRQRDELVR